MSYDITYDSPTYGERWAHKMDGERISLRLEKDDLRLIDEFIEMSPEISNRSQLARVAIRSYIDGLKSRTSPGASNKITIEVPRAAMRTIEVMVRDGIYKTPVDAIEDCIRDAFITKEYIEEVKKKALHEHMETLHKVCD